MNLGPDMGADATKNQWIAKERPLNGNPLNPLREYIETMQKFKEQFKEVPDLLMDKINQLILKSDKNHSASQHGQGHRHGHGHGNGNAPNNI